MELFESIVPVALETASTAWAYAAPAAPVVGPGLGGLIAWAFRARQAKSDARRDIAIALVEVQSDLAHLYFTKPGKRLNNGNDVPKRFVEEIFGQYRARIEQQAALVRAQHLPAPFHAVISAYAMKVYDLGPEWARRSNAGVGFDDAYLQTKQSLFNALEAIGQRKRYKAIIDRLEALSPTVNSEANAPVGPAGFTDGVRTSPLGIRPSPSPEQSPAR